MKFSIIPMMKLTGTNIDLLICKTNKCYISFSILSKNIDEHIVLDIIYDMQLQIVGI